MLEFDGVEHAGKLWLVTGWIRGSREGLAWPERAIRFDTLPHRAVAEAGLDYQGILLPIPEAQLRQELPSEIEYEDHPRFLAVGIQQLQAHRRRG